MSLINDALKRARQSIQRKTTNPAADGSAPLQPAYVSAATSDGFDWSYLKLALLAFLVIGGVGLKVWNYYRTIPVKAAATTAAHSNSATNNNPIAIAKRTFYKVHALHAEGEANYSMIDAKPAGASPAAPAAPVAAKVEAAPRAPQIASVSATTGGEKNSVVSHKLQAIFYRELNSSALINGKSVGVGEEVDGARVKTIARQSVTLEYAGAAKELSLR
jgi:hypothetical protein